MEFNLGTIKLISNSNLMIKNCCNIFNDLVKEWSLINHNLYFNYKIPIQTKNLIKFTVFKLTQLLINYQLC